MLDQNGQAQASFNIPPGTDNSLVGTTVHHAAVVIELIPNVILHAVFATNAVQVTLSA